MLVTSIGRFSQKDSNYFFKFPSTEENILLLILVVLLWLLGLIVMRLLIRNRLIWRSILNKWLHYVKLPMHYVSSIRISTYHSTRVIAESFEA